MTVKRYFAETARECLKRVKADLGADAVVMSNRAVAGGVEITAMSADSLDALSQQAAARAPAAPPAAAEPARH
ncbi:MAG TPA: flagellar biosynthesis protein FlhF, partial [Rhodocyclaceae bacterium]